MLVSLFLFCFSLETLWPLSVFLFLSLCSSSSEHKSMLGVKVAVIFSGIFWKQILKRHHYFFWIYYSTKSVLKTEFLNLHTYAHTYIHIHSVEPIFSIQRVITGCSRMWLRKLLFSLLDTHIRNLSLNHYHSFQKLERKK